jgi:hypothetical protein
MMDGLVFLPVVVVQQLELLVQVDLRWQLVEEPENKMEEKDKKVKEQMNSLRWLLVPIYFLIIVAFSSNEVSWDLGYLMRVF